MRNDDCTEAEALSEQDDYAINYHLLRGMMGFSQPVKVVSPAATIESMTSRYAAAEKAKVGSEIVCPGCGKKFKKKSYQQKFCRNKGPNNCKDKYWNTTDDERRERAQYFK